MTSQEEPTPWWGKPQGEPPVDTSDPDAPRFGEFLSNEDGAAQSGKSLSDESLGNEPLLEKGKKATKEEKVKKSKKGHKYVSRPLVPFLIVLLIVTVFVGIIAFTPDLNTPRKSHFGATLYPSNTTQALGQCGGIYDFDVPVQYTGEIPENFFDNPYGYGTIARKIPVHPMTVPVYGYFTMDRKAPTKKFYTTQKKETVPQTFELLGYMWQGYTVIWYDTEKTDSVLANSLKHYVESHDHVIAVPWGEEEQQRPLPMNRNFAMSAWGISQSCNRWSDDLMDQFQKFVKENPIERDTANPPKARVDSNGELYEIAISDRNFSS